MRKIDEDAYNKGGAAFAKGKSLRSIFEPMIEESNKPFSDRSEDKENYFNSMMLGFADALLTKLRSR